MDKENGFVIIGAGNSALIAASAKVAQAVNGLGDAIIILNDLAETADFAVSNLITYKLPDPCCQLFREKSKKNWKTRPFWEK